MKMPSSTIAPNGRPSLRNIRPPTIRKIGVIAFLGFACVVSGLLAAVLPWWLIIALLALPMFLVVAVTYPIASVFILLTAIAGAIPSFLLPEIPIGIGKVLPQDIFLLALIVLALIKTTPRKDAGMWAATKPFSAPLVGMVACAVLGVLVGVVLYGAAPKDAISEFRNKIFWLVAFLPIAFVKTEHDLRIMIGALIVLGAYIAIAVLLQFQFGFAVLANARVEDLATGAVKYSDITRSTAGGNIYWVILALFLCVARILGHQRFPLVSGVIAVLCAAGILVSFGRGIWIATFFALLLVSRNMGGVKAVMVSSVIAGTIGLLAIGALSAVKPGLLDAVVERLVSTKDEGADKSSLGWRIDEARFASTRILQNPILGTGLGVPYKPRLDLFAGWEQVRYIHNSYLGLWLKTGAISLGLAFALVFLVLRTAGRLLREEWAGYGKYVVATIGPAFLVPVVTGVTQPEWLVQTGICFFAFMIGLLISCRNMKPC